MGSSERFANGYGRNLGRAYEVLRSEGVRALWFRILGQAVYRRTILFERDLFEKGLEESLRQQSAAIEVTISELKWSEADEYAAFLPGVTAAEVRSRLEQGHRCFIARHEGIAANAVWAATGSARIRYLDCEIQLAPDEVYIYESYTAPAFRRRHIAGARAAAMLQYFRGSSFTRMLAAVMPENAGGIGAALKAGYRPIGVIGWAGIRPWRRYFCRIEAGSRPVTLNRRPSPRA